MSFCLIIVETVWFCQDSIREMVVLINKEIHFLSCLLTFLAKIVQLFYCAILPVHLFFDVGRQILCIHIAEVVKLCVAMCIESLLVILKIGIHHGKVERDNQIGIMLRCRILADIQSSKQFLKPVSHIDVVILFEHGEGKALAETTRADIEEIHVGSFYFFYKICLIYIIAVVSSHGNEVHDSVRDALAINVFALGIFLLCDITIHERFSLYIFILSQS